MFGKWLFKRSSKCEIVVSFVWLVRVNALEDGEINPYWRERMTTTTTTSSSSPTTSSPNNNNHPYHHPHPYPWNLHPPSFKLYNNNNHLTQHQPSHIFTIYQLSVILYYKPSFLASRWKPWIINNHPNLNLNYLSFSLSLVITGAQGTWDASDFIQMVNSSLLAPLIWFLEIFN